MKVLIVARCKNGHYAPFISEQVEALRKAGIECEYFGVEKNGYLKQIPAYKTAIKQFNPDIVHAHYGLCALFATFQNKVPVVSTYHGSDINNSTMLKLSRIAIKRSAFNIFVSQKNIDIAKPQGKYALIPCGINIEDYPEMSKQDARVMMGLDQVRKYVLFAGAFDNPVKNARLAKDAVSQIDDFELLELKGYNRSEVSALMHAADVFLMTSYSEGSPQVIKEALACGCPIVSVDVGDVKNTIQNIDNCYISDRNLEDIKSKIISAINGPRSLSGLEVIKEKGLDNKSVAKRIQNVYESII